MFIFIVILAAVLSFSTSKAEQTLPTLEPKDWIGEEFVILPLAPSQRQYGYNHLRSPVGGYIVPTYEEVAGKTATVTEVDIPGRGDWKVTMKVHDEEKLVTAVSSTGSFPNLMHKNDLDWATVLWVGDTLWFTGSKLATVEDKAIEILKYSEVVVDSIGLGWDNNKPIRFHVHTLSNEHGFVDAHASNTNVATEVRNKDRVSDLLLEENPRIRYPWSEEVWTAIQKGQVATGMTTEQVKFSWGEPYKTERTFEESHPDVNVTETWWYGKSELRFDHGILKSFYEK